MRGGSFRLHGKARLRSIWLHRCLVWQALARNGAEALRNHPDPRIRHEATRLYRLSLEQAATVSAMLNRTAVARQYAERVLELGRLLGRAEEASSLWTAALVYAEMHDLKTAGRYFDQAAAVYRELSDPNEAQVCVRAGSVFDAAGDRRSALAWYRRALALALYRRQGDDEGASELEKRIRELRAQRPQPRVRPPAWRPGLGIRASRFSGGRFVTVWSPAA